MQGGRGRGIFIGSKTNLGRIFRLISVQSGSVWLWFKAGRIRGVSSGVNYVRFPKGMRFHPPTRLCNGCRKNDGSKEYFLQRVRQWDQFMDWKEISVWNTNFIVNFLNFPVPEIFVRDIHVPGTWCTSSHVLQKISIFQRNKCASLSVNGFSFV